MITGQDDTDWEILRLLQMDGRMTNSELAEKIHRSESACHRRVRRLAGDADYLLHVVAADTAHFERLYRSHLSRFPGVARIRSSFALRTVCKRTAYEADRPIESAS